MAGIADHKLKTYQEDCLKALRGFLQQSAKVGAAAAFNAIEDIKVKYRAVPGWEKSLELPYVCLRVPTGGGKTLIAAYAIGVVTREFLQSENSVVLWLAPTGQIVEQTIKALKDPAHPYRRALEKDFGGGGGVTVLDIQEALYVTRGTLDGSTTIIVSTIQALRVEDTDNRKVYEQAGALQHHFSEAYEVLKASLADAPDVDVYSLAHVLRSRRPIVIMDEAHNARSVLSFAFLQRLDPSAIVEFTATPDQKENPSNVLLSITASALKDADMIKLPIRMVARPQWKETVQGAVAKRDKLEEAAKAERAQTGEYIRPIVLVQAQPKAEHGEPITVDVLYKSLREDFGIPAAEIARATGEDGPLPDDILSEKCPIRYVLTVQKLREGWDCPFAYILCSASNLTSKTAVEQTLGRILRMPRAVLKKNPDLNQAYAFVTGEQFEATAKSLTDALVANMGFSIFEAKQAIEKQETLDLDGVGLFAKAFTEKVEEAPALATLPPEVAQRVSFDAATGALTYAGVGMSDAECDAIAATFTTEEAKTSVQKLKLRSWNEPVYPAALGQPLSVPMLCVKRPPAEGKAEPQVELFEDQHRAAAWKLSTRSAALSEAVWSPAQGMSKVGTVDVTKKGALQYTAGEIQFIKELRGQMLLHDTHSPKTVPQLVAWLDRAIYNPWLTPGDKVQFLTRVVRHLSEDRNLALEDVLASRFTLVDKAEALIDEHQRMAVREEYNLMLMPGAHLALVTDPRIAFSFPLKHYPAPTIYTGKLIFRRHYYKMPAQMNGKEAECAAAIDKHPNVRYWVRNLTRHDMAFWLQTSTDKFYPDFVVMLNDGRVAAIEYKAFTSSSNDDSKEKSAVGEAWAACSQGKCLFAMVTEHDFQAVVAQLLAG